MKITLTRGDCSVILEDENVPNESVSAEDFSGLAHYQLDKMMNGQPKSAVPQGLFCPDCGSSRISCRDGKPKGQSIGTVGAYLSKAIEGSVEN